MSQIKDYPQLTAVMCTYGRFTCVERAMNCYLAQTYPNKRLIIYNTDTNNRYEIQDWFNEKRILVWNNNTDYLTKENYTNVGAIRRDALDLVSDGFSGYVVTWDDDDVFLPHFLQQAVDRMRITNKPCFKPAQSFFFSGGNLRLVKNTMEASVVVSAAKVREYGYLLDTGREGLGWYTKLRDMGELDENDDYCIPSYCFDWETNLTGGYVHRQSGDIDNPNNFENHKKNTTDFVGGREISVWSTQDLIVSYKPYHDYFCENRGAFPAELFEQYVGKDFHLSSI